MSGTGDVQEGDSILTLTPTHRREGGHSTTTLTILGQPRELRHPMT